MSSGRHRSKRQRKQKYHYYLLSTKDSLIMADITDIYRTPLLSAKTLGKAVLTCTIEACYPETVTGEDKQSKDRLIIEMNDGDTRVSLNKTNAMLLAAAFGKDYDNWVGKKIKISTQKVDMRGTKVDGLLITPLKK